MIFSVNVPSVMVAGIGHDTVFTCESQDAVNYIEWLINGTLLTHLQLSNVDQSFDEPDFGSLQFRSVPSAYNGTKVQCIANSTSAGIITSSNSTLLVQGS